jgi:D-alanyl-D-alanine carboxypeptidase
MIQIGAFPAETQAHDRLKEAQNVAKSMLGAAEPFTERVNKPDGTLYRARFAGFDRDHAEAACKYLKRNEIACLALKN